MSAPTSLPGRKSYLTRLDRLASIKTRQAQQIRNADNTALGERAAGEADLDAAALRWALRRLDPSRETSDGDKGRVPSH